MKKALALILVCMSLTVHAKETPLDEFSMENNITNNTSVTLLTVDNVNKACDIESKERGYGGFNINKKMEGCSFWKAQPSGAWTCTVIVGKKTNYWIIGHEMRHCFQGKFH